MKAGMAMPLNPTLLRWAGLALAALVVLAGVYAKGRHDVQVKFNAYKAEVKAQADAQEEKTRQIEAKNAKATQQSADNYRKQLAVLRSYYAQRLPNAGTSRVPELSGATAGTDGATTNDVSFIPAADVLASQCAKTTLMLTGLQGWVTKVYENTND